MNCKITILFNLTKHLKIKKGYYIFVDNAKLHKLECGIKEYQYAIPEQPLNQAIICAFNAYQH